MNQFVIAAVACASGLLSLRDVHAQTAQLQVQALANAPVDTRMSEKIRNGNKADALAPKLQLRAIVSTPSGAPFQTTLEWLVFGRVVGDAMPGSQASPELVLMQSSK